MPRCVCRPRRKKSSARPPGKFSGRISTCGFLVLAPTCKPGAIRLERTETTTVPPKDSARLYLNILKKKVGSARQMIMLTRQLLGRLA